MTAQVPPFALQNASHSAALFRQAVASLINPNGGVIGDADLNVEQNGTPDMHVLVLEGQVWMPGTLAAPGQSIYYGYNDASDLLAIAASNPTNPRIDLVTATARDAAYAGAANDWVIQVVTGTPTAGATLANPVGAPAVPSNSQLLAYVLIPAAATAITTADIADGRGHADSIIVPRTELSSVQVGSLPPAGTPIRRIVGSFTGACSTAFGSSFLPNLDLTALGLSHGYTALVTNGDPQTNVIGVCAISATSTLTALSVQVFSPSGGTVGTANARANYEIIGA